MYTPAFITKQGAFDSDVNGQLNSNFQQLLLSLGLGSPVAIAASGAINPNASGCYIFTKSTAAATMTLAAPIAGAPVYNAFGTNVGGNDGQVLVFSSATAEGHTITSTGNFADGANHANEATFASYAGASIAFIAYNGKWLVLFNNNVTMS